MQRIPQVKKTLPLKVMPDLKERIECQAKKERRSRNGLIEYAIKFYLKVVENKKNEI